MTATDFAERKAAFHARFDRGRRHSRLLSLAVAVLLPLLALASTAGAQPAIPLTPVLAAGVAAMSLVVIHQFRARRWLHAHGLDCPGCGRPLVFQDEAALRATGQCSHCGAPVLDRA